MTENLRFLYLYGYNIRFRTFSKLERYTKFVEWDYGYIVVMAKYEGHERKKNTSIWFLFWKIYIWM